MKNKHPETVKTKIECACGKKFDVESTKDDLEVEICSNCHPFYTGKEKIVDKMGRVEKFKKKMEKAEKEKEEKKKREAKKKKKEKESDKNNDKEEEKKEKEEKSKSKKDEAKK